DNHQEGARRLALGARAQRSDGDRPWRLGRDSGGDACRRWRADQGCLHLRQPGRRPRLDLGPRPGSDRPPGGDAQRRDGLPGERAGEPGRRRARYPPVRRGRGENHLHHLLRLHGPDDQRRRKLSRDRLRPHLRLQDRRERRYRLRQDRGAALRLRPDCGRDDGVEPDWLRRRLPHPRGDPRHQRLHSRRPRDESRGDRPRRLDEHLVRPPEGAAGCRSAARRRRRRHRPAPGHPRSAAGGRSPRRLRRRLQRRHGHDRPGRGPDQPDLALGGLLHRHRPEGAGRHLGTDPVLGRLAGRPGRPRPDRADGAGRRPGDGRGRDRPVQERRGNDLHRLHRPHQRPVRPGARPYRHGDDRRRTARDELVRRRRRGRDPVV
ncbi:MAG: Nucleoside ABC transporter, periplasmic nucleoside-binding protein, partial [uncultured Thermomicrobiales bacterium]